MQRKLNYTQGLERKLCLRKSFSKLLFIGQEYIAYVVALTHCCVIVVAKLFPGGVDI